MVSGGAGAEQDDGGWGDGFLDLPGDLPGRSGSGLPVCGVCPGMTFVLGFGLGPGCHDVITVRLWGRVPGVSSGYGVAV